MRSYSVRIVSIRKARKSGESSAFLDVTMNETFEASSKSEARKLAREKYPRAEGYDIGLAWEKK